jgi:hypothetical protein
VTGANGFFHLRPSDARRQRIPNRFLRTAVRSGRDLTSTAVTHATVKRWLREDDPVLLLHLRKDDSLPKSVENYLSTADGLAARRTYKCRNRDPWYSVPDVTVPSAFLSYMSGDRVALVANRAACVCTNSVHAVRLTGRLSMMEIQRRWGDPFTTLSCELEGHPLGGGVLKLEPREALRVVLADRAPSAANDARIQAGINELRRWRHYD